MNAKNFFYTVAGSAILFVLILFIFRSCNREIKQMDKEKIAENRALTNARIDRINEVITSPFVQKMMGLPNYNVEVSDTINGELIKREIIIPKACFDTIKVGQRVNYLSFSQITEPQAEAEVPKGWLWSVFLIAIGFVMIGFIITMVGKALRGELFFL